MISTCTDSIEATNKEVTNALTGFEYIFDLNPDSNKLFDIDLDTTQSIYIKLLINMASSSSSIVFVNVIRKSDLSTVRSIKLKTSTVITTDLTNGQYYICIRTLAGTFSLSLTVDYLRYSRSITFDNIMISHGSENTLDELTIKRAEVECNQPLKYTMIGGRLPTGLQMDKKGRIFGTLPIIDDENKKNFPSFNLYHSNFDYTTPIGVRYEFTVKLEIEGGVDDEIYDIRDFCILIVNNWSLTEPYLDAEIYDVTGEVDNMRNAIVPKSLCPPCNIGSEVSINTGLYVFDGDAVVMKTPLIDIDIGYINEYDSITKGYYVSRTPLIENIHHMDYVINAYENGNDDEIIIPNIQPDALNEYIILPEGLVTDDAIYNWVVSNYTLLVDAGYNETTLNKYIEKSIDGLVTYRNNRLNLDLIVNDDIPYDPQLAYTQAHEDIMKVEPMYIRGTFIPYELNIELTYEAYR